MFNPRLRAASRMKWTRAAADCYFLGCQCEKCEVFRIIGKKCKMKYTVLELVRRHGIPEREENDETAYESEETCKAESKYQARSGK